MIKLIHKQKLINQSKDLVGFVYGKLTVISFLGYIKDNEGRNQVGIHPGNQPWFPTGRAVPLQLQLGP